MLFPDYPPLPFIGLFFIVGISVGFGHCIGMCGPIAVSLSLRLKGRPALLPAVFYTLGRITTYGLLGALMGYSGSFTGTAAKMAGLQKAMLVFSGIMIIAMGAHMAGWMRIGNVFSDKGGSIKVFLKGFRLIPEEAVSAAYFPLGLLLGLLPCGPVYTALVAVAGAGLALESRMSGALFGMGFMLAFGIGTAPAMLLVSMLAGGKWASYRLVINRIGVFLMFLIGGYYLVKGFQW